MKDERSAVRVAVVRQVRVGAVVGAALLMAASIAATASAAGQPQVSVYFVQGEQLTPVTRPGTTALDAVRQLIAGPTRTERDRGFRTYVPAPTRVRSVTVANGIATVDLTQLFATGTDPASMIARLSELVQTLTSLQGKESAAARERRNHGRHVPGHLDGQTDHAPLPRNPERGRPDAAAREAPAARPSRQEDAAAPDRARLPARRGRRWPLRTGDTERNPRLPEMGTTRPHRPARRGRTTRWIVDWDLSPRTRSLTTAARRWRACPVSVRVTATDDNG
jgi:Sporulation and spore germination